MKPNKLIHRAPADQQYIFMPTIEDTEIAMVLSHVHTVFRSPPQFVAGYVWGVLTKLQNGKLGV